MTAADRYLAAQVRDIVLAAVAGHDVSVYLFGSRAEGKAAQSSDVDVAIDAHEPLPPGLLPALREALEESHVPYDVDVVDLGSASTDLRRRVRREGIPWRGSTSA